MSQITSMEKSRAFKVRSIDVIAPQDRERLAARFKTFTSALDAQRRAMAEGLTLTMLDLHGRVISVRWQGIEVALLFQHQITQINLLPNEAMPATIVRQPEDAWMMINLISSDEHKLSSELRSLLDTANASMKQLQGLLISKDKELELKDSVLDRLDAIDKHATAAVELMAEDKKNSKKGKATVTVEKLKEAWKAYLKSLARDREGVIRRSVLNAKRHKIAAKKEDEAWKSYVAAYDRAVAQRTAAQKEYESALQAEKKLRRLKKTINKGLKASSLPTLQQRKVALAKAAKKRAKTLAVKKTAKLVKRKGKKSVRRKP